MIVCKKCGQEVDIIRMMSGTFRGTEIIEFYSNTDIDDYDSVDFDIYRKEVDDETYECLNCGFKGYSVKDIVEVKE